MNEKVQRYFELKDRIRELNELRHARRAELSDTRSWASDPTLVTIRQEWTDAFIESQILAVEVILANLAYFGLHDVRVDGFLYMSNGDRHGPIRWTIAELCNAGIDTLATHFGLSWSDAECIVVEHDGQQIGRIRGSVFCYEKAPDLRTALGWMIATDGGREVLIESVDVQKALSWMEACGREIPTNPFDLDKATFTLLEVIFQHGLGRDVFFKAFFQALQSMFLCGYTSNSVNGHWLATRVLWPVATRQLNMEHPGYSCDLF